VKLFPQKRRYRLRFARGVRCFPPVRASSPSAASGPTIWRPWWAEGATGFGTGSNLYKPGADPAQVRAVAAAYRSGFAALPARNR
jgi:hypothetical protein